MHYEKSYKGDNNAGRQAMLDLVEWFGFAKSHLIFRAVKAAKTFHELDRIDFAIGIGGVSGYPVGSLFRRFHGEEAIAKWCTVQRWDPVTLIKGD